MDEPGGGEQVMASRCPRPGRGRARALGVTALLLVASCPLVARAQDDDAARRAAAQALFDQASTLMDRHDYASACPKLEEVARLQPGKVGTLVALGECFTGAGRVASAWTMYRQAADRAAALNDARGPEAQRKADMLAPRLPHLAVHVDAPMKDIAGLEVSRDGVTLGKGAWDTPIPIDPGDHVVEARAPGYAPFRATVTLAERDSKDVTITLQPGPPGASRPLPPTSSSTRRVLGIVGLSLGGVGLAIGAVTGGLAIAKHASLSKTCTDTSCPSTNQPAIDTYHAVGDASTAGFVAGGVLAAAGLVLVLTAPKPAPETGRAGAGLTVVPLLGAGWVGARGTF